VDSPTVKHQHFIIYKPYGYLRQFVNNGPKQNSKKLLGELGKFPEDIMAIGRLDEKSEGLLLLTIDGQVSNHICISKVEKEYYAQIDGTITDEALETLINGLKIGVVGKKYKTQPCEVKLLNPTPVFSIRSKKLEMKDTIQLLG